MMQTVWNLYAEYTEPVLIALWAFLIILTLALVSVALIVRWCLTCMWEKVAASENVLRRIFSKKG